MESLREHDSARKPVDPNGSSVTQPNRDSAIDMENPLGYIDTNDDDVLNCACATCFSRPCRCQLPSGNVGDLDAGDVQFEQFLDPSVFSTSSGSSSSVGGGGLFMRSSSAGTSGARGLRPLMLANGTYDGLGGQRDVQDLAAGLSDVQGSGGNTGMSMQWREPI